MSLDNFSYHMPTKVVYGQNSLKYIDTYIDQRKALLITSQGFVARGLIDEVNTYTDNIVKVISNVKSHPEFIDIEDIYNQAHTSQFDLIIAIGGGSVMDTAKFVAVHNKNKSYQFVEDLTKVKIPKKDYKIIPIISIPTTAGTGSEVTPYATIWDTQGKQKYSLNLPDLFSEVAIYDPILTLTVPRDITIQTGLDALSHSLESIWNKNATPITISYAVKSAKLIVSNLVDLSNNLDNVDLRGNMMMACMYAGLAFSNTQTAIAHAISYYVTAHKGIPHGIACSFTLPVLIDNIVGKHDFVDRSLIEIFGQLGSAKLRRLFTELGVSTEFSSFDINNQDLIELGESLKGNKRADNSLITLKELVLK
ncbi:MAG: phosphonoacetaldehyde reductase [Candidatus Ruthia sp.]|jgi:phosphonate metabolism-associated iron-containing alcohol dehydrogenase|nr:phosphonoacetaldehyde reductase [Candidatus Ruthturnera sp.]